MITKPNFKVDWKDIDYYNADDLNRVESNTQFISEFLISLYYRVNLELVKTDRNNKSIEFLSSINRVEKNIETIRKSFLTPPGYEDTKTWILGMGFTYLDANRLERNLELLYEWSLKARENQIFCGTFSCGMDWEGGVY